MGKSQVIRKPRRDRRFSTEDELRELGEMWRQLQDQAQVAKHYKVAQSVVSRALKRARELGLITAEGGRIDVLRGSDESLPARGKVKRFILTSAQNHTRIHPGAWMNLQAFAEFYDARIMVSTFKYNKEALGQRKSAKYESRDEELHAEYAAGLLPFICDDRVNLTKNLAFCGELNILPTAVEPLSGLEPYTYRQSAIVPHPKMEQISVPAIMEESVKLLYTTGCVTMRNYIKRKEGFKAEQFHKYGGLLVEIDDKGRWYCRHLEQGQDGTMYDLDRVAKDGRVHKSNRVAAIVWGDIHASRVDPEVAAVSWRERGCMLDTLKPEHQIVHDLFELTQSHHNRRDPHKMFEVFVRGEWAIAKEIKLTADELWNQIARPWCNTIVADSNHDRHIVRFLQEVDWRRDLPNAVNILKLNLMILQAIESGEGINVAEATLRLEAESKPSLYPNLFKTPVRFLKKGERYVVLKEVGGGTECSLHGSEGANGAKGTLAGFATMARRVIFADKHAVGRKGHAIGVGTSTQKKMGYNERGLSSWTHAHAIIYPNNTATTVSVWEGKWRA